MGGFVSYTRANPFAPRPSALDEEERALVAAREAERAQVEEAQRAERRRLELAAEEEAQRARVAELRGAAPAAAPAGPVPSAPEEAPGPLAGPEWSVRGQLERAAPTLEDRRVPFESGAPMRVPGSPDQEVQGRVRAIRLPNGKILLTNAGRDVAGTEVAGADLYNAVRGQEPAPAPTAAPEGDVLSTPTTQRYGLRMDLPLGGFSARDVQGRAGGGTVSMGDEMGRGSIADNPDTRLRLSLEDAERATAVYRAQAGTEEARQAAEFARLSPEERAQVQAASKAPELIGLRAIQEEYQKVERARAAFNEWQRRAEDPNDPAFLPPAERERAAQVVQDRLGLTGAEERIKTLASIVAQQRVPQGLLGGLGG